MPLGMGAGKYILGDRIRRIAADILHVKLAYFFDTNSKFENITACHN